MLSCLPNSISLLFQEAHRAGNELGELGLNNQHLIINGGFTPISKNPIAEAFAEKSGKADLPTGPPSLADKPDLALFFQLGENLLD